MATVLVEDQVEIPGTVATLTAFRHWALSEAFPKRGRIDWVGSQIEVDMSPEDLFTHGTLKTAIVASLWPLARRTGYNLFTGETRISSVAGNVSAEPDVVAVSDAAIDTDRVRLTPKAGGETDRFVELEGGPELVVEIVSDASVGKDRRRLPPAYFAAGVTEFWLIDARGPELEFVIHHRGENGFVPVAVAADGGQPSTVFSCGFQLIRGRNARGRYVYDLVVVEASRGRG
jgi:Uma2 family endonuclease